MWNYLVFLCFPTKFEIKLYFQQFNVNLFQEWRFALNSVYNTATRIQYAQVINDKPQLYLKIHNLRENVDNLQAKNIL